jgi:acyl-CoA reductase-like NAD-dependent aldehyde dehydrogenase
MSELHVKSPYNDKELKVLPFATDRDWLKVVETAQSAFSLWRTSTSFRRSEVLLAVASELESRRDEFAQLMTSEAGKPITYSKAEVDRGLGVLRWAASEATRFSGELLRLDTAKTGRDGFGIHTRFPKGVIFGITPFNFPLNLVLHKIAPAVATGCSIVIKPSPFTPLTTLKLVEIFEKFEKGLVQCLIADNKLTETVTRSQEIAMVTFTGSARVGKLVQQQACDKPVTLELGGNAWVIISDDVPETSFESIAKRICGGAFGYAGQSCISVQNVAISSAHWDGFEKALKEATLATVFGDPENSLVTSGPVINQAATRRISEELKKAAGKLELTVSAKLEGSLRPGTGNLIAPTLMSVGTQKISADLLSLQNEEIFGPVMMAQKFETLDEIIGTINQSRYGLQAGVFTQNLGAIEKLYRELEVGGVVVNDVPTTRYDHQPYGGVKESGVGREGLRYAMDEMTTSKFLALSSQIPG